MNEEQYQELKRMIAQLVEEATRERFGKIVGILTSIQKSLDIWMSDMDEDRKHLGEMRIAQKTLAVQMEGLIEMTDTQTERITERVTEHTKEAIENATEQVAEIVEPAMETAVDKIKKAIPLLQKPRWWERLKRR